MILRVCVSLNLIFAVRNDYLLIHQWCTQYILLCIVCRGNYNEKIFGYSSVRKNKDHVYQRSKYKILKSILSYSRGENIKNKLKKLVFRVNICDIKFDLILALLFLGSVCKLTKDARTNLYDALMYIASNHRLRECNLKYGNERFLVPENDHIGHLLHYLYLLVFRNSENLIWQ